MFVIPSLLTLLDICTEEKNDPEYRIHVLDIT